MRCFVMKTPQYDEDARKFSCTHVFDRFKKAVEGAEDYQHNPGNVFFKTDDSVSIFNIGTGKGTSVIEAVKAFEKACGHEINHKIGPRRPGDIAVCYASTKKAENVLGFKARYGIDEMCSSCWKWQTMNPEGLKD